MDEEYEAILRTPEGVGTFDDAKVFDGAGAGRSDDVSRALALQPRYVDTPGLRRLIREGREAGYNRQLNDADVARLDPNGFHILHPILIHHYIAQRPAPEHLRCEVMAKVYGKDEAERAVMDVSLRSFNRLRLVVEPRHAKPDPAWEETVTLLGEFIEQVQVEAPGVGWPDDGSSSMLRPYPLDWLTDLEPYYVSAEMCALIDKAADGMPSHELAPTDLLTTSGWVVLETPVFVDVPTFGRIPVRVFAWKTGANGVRVSTLWDFDHPDAPVPHWVDRRGYRSRLWPALHWLWDWSQPVDSPLHWANATPETAQALTALRKYLMALWLLSGQRLAILSGRQPPRGLRRRAERLHLPSTLLVVTLRRAFVRSQVTGEPRQVDWSHRWLVSGHWRRIWNKKEQRLRLTWVTPYIKGPDDKPLIIKDRFYKFER